ncbi:MAG: hypothetical protein MUD08_19145 [Cytophagales bacterium]|nr:hypothetical protein [Cytophagales bacterium]
MTRLSAQRPIRGIRAIRFIRDSRQTPRPDKSGLPKTLPTTILPKTQD